MDLLWTSFLNSEWHDWRGTGRPMEDRLDRSDWLPAFLAEWQLKAPLPPSPEVVAALKELRRWLRRLAESLSAGGTAEPDDLERLNRLMAGGPVIRQLGEGSQLNLLPAQESWPQVMAEIAASCARTLAEGEGARVRICENTDCLWAFYDDTRNRTKRFCEDKTCGNLMKVRRFRAKQKNASTT